MIYEALLKQLDSPDTLWLTASKRLSRHLLKIYTKIQAEQNKLTWISPQILPLEIWLEKNWQESLIQGKTKKSLLETQQESYLWEKIVDAELGSSLLSNKLLANQAAQAWELVQQFHIAVDAQFKTNPENQLFFQMYHRFKNLCEQENYLSRSELLAFVTQEIIDKKLNLPKKIVLLGFTVISPNLNHFCEALKECGAQVFFKPHNEKKAKTQRLAATDTKNEINRMARWVKQELSQDPEKKLLCIVPNMTECRPMLLRIFQEILPKHSCNISSGNALSDEAIIYSALQLLKLNQHTYNWQLVSYILRSVFILAGEQEALIRAQLDFELRRKNTTRFTRKSLLILAQRCPQLYQALSTFFNLLAPEKQSPEQWAHYFSQQLAALGWPGERGLSSREYQAIQHWNQALQKLAKLQLVCKSCNLAEAWEALSEICNKELFQVETPDSNVQVLGLLEAINIEADKIWLMGLSEDQWPNKAQANPFIPYSLQSLHQLPRSSAERELEFSYKIMQSIQEQCAELILSYPTCADDRVLLASPLITQYELIHEAEPPLIIEPKLNLESLIDIQAPALQVNEIIRGGSGILKQQAACPFRAFSEFRLKALSLNDPITGLDGAERGALMHQALQAFWNEVQSQHELLSLSYENLKNILNRICEACIQAKPPRHLPQAYLRLEQERLVELLLRWMEIEKQREPFVVIAEESWRDIQLAGIDFHIQIDRIDQLEDGSLIIIDYKTGRLTEISSWFGERPDEPQLPLYAATYSKPVQGLYFAKLRAEELGFKGLSETHVLGHGKTLAELKYVNPDITWQEQLQEWKSILQSLANDFKSGTASVDPKFAEKTCSTCSLHALCRIHES